MMLFNPAMARHSGKGYRYRFHRVYSCSGNREESSSGYLWTAEGYNQGSVQGTSDSLSGAPTGTPLTPISSKGIICSFPWSSLRTWLVTGLPDGLSMSETKPSLGVPP
jgi:hypothetical protein